MYFPLFVGVLGLYLLCYALLSVHSSFAIILKRKRRLVALLLLSYRCIVTINVLWFSILVLIKRRPSRFTGNVENKYRHEHVMITDLYIVKSCMTVTFINAFNDPFIVLRISLGIHSYPTLPPPLWNALPFFNQLAFRFG